MANIATKRLELGFIPSSVIGHPVSTAEFAIHFLDRNERLSITVIVIHLPLASAEDRHSRAFSVSDTRIRWIELPAVEPPSSLESPENFFSFFIENHKPHVEHAIMTKLLADDSITLTGLVVDLFCTPMIDIAQKIRVPSYLFFTSSSAFLGLMLFLPAHHTQVGAEFGPSDTDSFISSYANPVPSNVLPSRLFNKDGYTSFLNHSRRFDETNGIIIYSFAEFEIHSLNSIITQPTVYVVGPLLTGGKCSYVFWPMLDEIRTWLADQPPSSVVFLCFGSIGSVDALQLKQIANALEASGQWFLWSIHRPPPEDKFVMPSEYQNFQEVLPDGFLEHTKGSGMVCGRAPQIEVLAHPSVFVSHCGWHSHCHMATVF